jgi:predicted membrane protein
MKKRASSIIFGSLLIIIGIGFLGNIFDIWHFTIFFRGWWTLFLIIPAIVSMINSKPNVGNVLLLIFGVVLLAANQFHISAYTVWLTAVAAFLILGGIALIVGKRGIPSGTFDAEPNNEETLKQFKLFSSSAVNIESNSFRGGKLTALFSDCVIDMRNIQPDHDIILNIGDVFSNVRIYAPENMNVMASGCTVFLAGMNNRVSYRGEGNHILYISGSCVFANMDII